MNPIRKEVRELVTLNEKIQSAILPGEQMTDTERGIIHMCVTELLSGISSTAKVMPNGHDGKTLDIARTDPSLTP